MILQSINDRAKSWVTVAVVFFIAVPFALWGVQQYFGGTGNPVVATVGHSHIRAHDLAGAVERARQEFRQIFGDSFNQEIIPENVLRRQALHRLVQEKALIQHVEEVGLVVTDEKLASEIAAIEAFQDDQGFSLQSYHSSVETQGWSIPEFENIMREALLVEQLERAIRDTVVLTDDQISRFWSITFQKRQAAYAIISYEKIKNALNITSQEAQNYFERYQEKFQKPEKVKLKYVELTPDQLAHNIKPTEEELQQRYEENKRRYQQPERRKLAHILIRKGTKNNEKQAVELLKKIRNQIHDGANFASLAEEYSDDSGSSGQGGDLGWLTQDSLVEELANPVFALLKGKISEPLASRYGKHLFLVQEIEPAQIQSYEEAREELRAQSIEQQANAQLSEWIERMEQIAFDEPESLKPISETFDLDIKTTGWLSVEEKGEGLLSYPEVYQTIREPEFHDQDYNSKPIKLSDNRWVVLRIVDQLPPEPMSFDEAKGEIIEIIKDERARKVAMDKREAWIQEISEISLSLEGLQHFVDADSTAQWHAPELYTRQSADRTNAELIQAIFSEDPPQQGEIKPFSLQLNNGDALVGLLLEVQAGTPLQDENMLQAQQQALRSSLAEWETQAYVESLVNSLHVKIRLPQS